MQVILSKDAEKHFNRLTASEQAKIKRKLQSLENNPYGGKKLRGKLLGYRSLQVWPYRIIYQINQVKQKVEVTSQV